MRMHRLMSVLVSVVVVGLGLAVVGGAETVLDPGEAIAEADRLFDRSGPGFDFVAYEGLLHRAIALWESALLGLAVDNVQSRAHTLNRLAQAQFELATGYLTSRDERVAAFGAGKDAALASLRLDPLFGETEARHGFRAALSSATDVAAIFWYGNTLGQWLNYHQITALFGGVRDVEAAFARALALDETYDAAGPHRALGSLIAQAHFVIGRDRSEAAFHFERCIELAPHHLEARVSYVKDYLIPTGDAGRAQALLGEVLELAQDPMVMSAYPFYNKLSLDQARSLNGGG